VEPVLFLRLGWWPRRFIVKVGSDETCSCDSRKGGTARWIVEPLRHAPVWGSGAGDRLLEVADHVWSEWAPRLLSGKEAGSRVSPRNSQAAQAGK